MVWTRFCMNKWKSHIQCQMWSICVTLYMQPSSAVIELELLQLLVNCHRICSNTLLWMSCHRQLGNTLRPRQNGCHLAEDIFNCIFLNENVWISLKISLKFVLKVPVNNTPALIQIMAWRQSGDKPLCEPMMAEFNGICIRCSNSMN